MVRLPDPVSRRGRRMWGGLVAGPGGDPEGAV